MPIDPNKRIEVWTTKTVPARTKAIVVTRLPSMRDNFTTKQNEILNMESQVRQVVNGAGVPTIQYPFYLCFGREMWALQKKGISGESLAIEAAVLIAKWVARGLTSAVLQGIRTDVFNVAAPIGP